jgi:hypothetical protein
MINRLIADSYKTLFDRFDACPVEKHKEKMVKMKWVLQSAIIAITCFTHGERQVSNDFLFVVLSEPRGRQEIVRLIKFIIADSLSVFKDDGGICAHIDSINSALEELQEDFINEHVTFPNEYEIVTRCIPVVRQFIELTKDDVNDLQKILFTDSK